MEPHVQKEMEKQADWKICKLEREGPTATKNGGTMLFHLGHLGIAKNEDRYVFF